MNLPKRVIIELTNYCNRICKGCPRLKTDYPQGNMNWPLFTKITHELPSNTIIVPFFRGESLLHPQFPHVMAALRKFKYVQLATNGDYANRETTKSIVDTCSFLSLSLHHYATEPYNSNVAHLLETAHRQEVTTQVSILESLLEEKDRFVFAESWLRYVDRVRVYVEHSHNGYGDTKLNIKDSGQPCFKPFSDMAIYWDGNVALCNHDWNSTLGLGNVQHLSIRDIWNSDLYDEVRKKQKQGNRRQIASCCHCDYWATDYSPDGVLGEVYSN